MPELPIPAEYEGSVCEIKTIENKLVATGHIREVAPKYIKIANRHNELKVVDYGMPIKVNIFNTELGFRVIIGVIYTSSKYEMSIISIENLVDTERRNYFRVDMDIKFKASYRPDPASDRMKDIEILVKDMSLSGLRFVSDLKFEKGTEIWVTMIFSKTKNAVLKCRILRIFEDEENSISSYGCEIVHDSKNNEGTDAFCAFLFRKQREFLKSTEEKKRLL